MPNREVRLNTGLGGCLRTTCGCTPCNQRYTFIEVGPPWRRIPQRAWNTPVRSADMVDTGGLPVILPLPAPSPTAGGPPRTAQF